MSEQEKKPANEAVITTEDGKKIPLPDSWKAMIENFMSQHPGKTPPIVIVNGQPVWLNGKTRRKFRSTKYKRELQRQMREKAKG